jgi:hypothetical protein
MANQHHRKRLGWFLLLCLAGLLLILSWPTERVSPGKRPSQTRRALETMKKRIAQRSVQQESPAASVSSDGEMLPHTVLRVNIHDPDSWSYPGFYGHTIRPEQYWPMWDEAPWPELESAYTLQELAENLRGDETGSLELVERFLDQAENDGLMGRPIDEMLTDPWSALVAMQAEHANTIVEQLFPEVGTVDFSPSVEIAEAITEKWPDDPAAEYARLHLLQVANDWASIEHDPQEALAFILDIVEHTEDSLVLDVAVGEFTKLDDIQLEADTIAQIEDAYDEVDSQVQGATIKALLTYHVQEQNWQKVDLWSERLLENDALNTHRYALFGTDPISVVSSLAGHRAVHEGRAPVNWGEEVAVAVHLCNEDAPLTHSTGVAGTWNDGWQWRNWYNLTARLMRINGATDPEVSDERVTNEMFPACIERYQWQLPPPHPLTLTLKVLL